MVKKACVTSFFSARKTPGEGAFFILAISGTGGCRTGQSAKSFSTEAFIPAVLKTPQPPGVTLAGKKYRWWNARRSLRETRLRVEYSTCRPKGESLPRSEERRVGEEC